MPRVNFEVGYTFPRGRQPNFAPYNQFQPVGNVGYAPLFQQPGRYPVTENAKRQQTALSQEDMNSYASAHGKPGLADAGLFNSLSTSLPLQDVPAVQAQQIALRARAASLPTVESLAAMNMGLGLK